MGRQFRLCLKSWDTCTKTKFVWLFEICLNIDQFVYVKILTLVKNSFRFFCEHSVGDEGDLYMLSVLHKYSLSSWLHLLSCWFPPMLFLIILRWKLPRPPSRESHQGQGKIERICLPFWKLKMEGYILISCITFTLVMCIGVGECGQTAEAIYEGCQVQQSGSWPVGQKTINREFF